MDGKKIYEDFIKRPCKWQEILVCKNKNDDVKSINKWQWIWIIRIEQKKSTFGNIKSQAIFLDINQLAQFLQQWPWKNSEPRRRLHGPGPGNRNGFEFHFNIQFKYHSYLHINHTHQHTQGISSISSMPFYFPFFKPTGIKTANPWNVDA